MLHVLLCAGLKLSLHLVRHNIWLNRLQDDFLTHSELSLHSSIHLATHSSKSPNDIVMASRVLQKLSDCFITSVVIDVLLYDWLHQQSQVLSELTV